ncbi:MAG: FecR domain-containing protein, partial [Planctomycetales bacterium]|nr:FecR domain-containing protein [Planctomycetales bacterium]
MVATVIVGAMLLGFWAIKVTHHQHIAEAPSKSVPSDARPEFVFVGRITGLVDVKWSDDPRFLPPYGFAYVPLGGKYILDAGLMEITYDSGAKIILQGPCTYEVESTAGGYLSLGKLTARVEKRGEGRGARGEGSESNPQSLIPNPLFSVRTPTAIVTDLGTEFGVEVEADGTCEVHVLKGVVEAVSLGAEGPRPQRVQLRRGEARRYRPGNSQATVIPARQGEFEGIRIVRPKSRREQWLAHSQKLCKDPALVAYYTFQPVAGDDPSVLRNLSAAGSLLDGAVVGAEWVYGRVPGKFGLYFHGPNSGDKVVLPHEEQFSFTGAFSVAVWFRVSRLTTWNQPLVTKGDSSWRLQQSIKTNQLTFDTNGEGEELTNTTSGQTDVADYRWHLAVAVYESDGGGAQKRLYLDGRLDAEGKTSNRLNRNHEPVWLGSNSMWPNREFHGMIDEAAIFSRALSGAEVAAMFEAGSPAGARTREGG